MSEPAAVELHGVSKVYRLYRKPSYRILDLLGLCPASPDYYTEHVALRPIDLSVARGDKVAIIGRNGAGKSTLLKLITGATMPTAGRLELRGRVSPLLQIGTGFHPEFTGRQNVFANLAHLGVVGADAARRFGEIVDFSELEPFMDQPMKTYSTGMTARLMFSTATSVEPEILVVDELLGVGDAYFSHKSFERMRQLCSDKGTTLLLVTHDLYGAMDLCDRFIWIDRGEVRHEGDGRTTVAAYEASIKEQEETRLRTRNRMVAEGALGGPLHVVVRSVSGFALSAPLYLDYVAVEFENGPPAELSVASGATGWRLTSESNLREPEEIDGRRVRALQTFGSVYHKAEWMLAAASSIPRALRLTWRYDGEEPAEAALVGPDNRAIFREVLPRAPHWQDLTISSSVRNPGEPTGQYGTGAIRITRVTFLDEAGSETAMFTSGARLRARVWLERRSGTCPPKITFVLGFTRAGTAAAAYVYSNDVDARAESTVVDINAEPLILGAGSWLVTCAVGEPDLYAHQFNPYFTVNDRWYHMLVRAFELRIVAGSGIDSTAFAVQPAVVVSRPATPSAPGV